MFWDTILDGHIQHIEQEGHKAKADNGAHKVEHSSGEYVSWFILKQHCSPLNNGVKRKFKFYLPNW